MQWGAIGLVEHDATFHQTDERVSKDCQILWGVRATHLATDLVTDLVTDVADGLL